MTNPDQNNDTEFTLADLCQSCGLSDVQITAYVQEGLLEVSGDDRHNWRFTETHLIMVRKASRLEQDLRLNPAGAVLALELMSKIEALEQRLRRASLEFE